MQKDSGPSIGKIVKNFRFLELIGSEVFGEVYRCEDLRDKSIIAVKVFSKRINLFMSNLQTFITRQIEILKKCNNPNIVRFLDYFETDRFHWIAYQLCNGSDLQKYLHRKKSLSEEQATNYLRQIVNGFKGLRQIQVVHRDFNLAKILLHDGECKISGLELAINIAQNAVSTQRVGTLHYMAPQVLEETEYGPNVDIWSIGVVYYQLLYGQWPFKKGLTCPALLQTIRKQKIPIFEGKNISQNARNFILKCLAYDPKNRMSWKEVYQHPLIVQKTQTKKHNNKDNNLPDDEDPSIGKTINKYKFLQLSGEGAYGRVFFCKDLQNESSVAIKIISKNKIKKYGLQKNLQREVCILKKCKNQNIIKFIDYFTTENYHLIVTEFCQGGDLQKYVQKKGKLSEQQATKYLKQIINGFKGVLQIGVVHRDLKLSNLFLNNQKCKIGDFGLSKEISEVSSATLGVGSLVYMAPQILRGQEYGPKVDIWSLGVSFYEMLYGHWPFIIIGSTKLDLFLKQIQNRKIPDFDEVKISQNAKSFILKCLALDYKERLSWQQISSHPLLS